MKAARIAGALIAAVVIAAVALLAIGIPSSAITKAIEDRVARDTGYRVTISGASRLALFPQARVTLEGVSLREADETATSPRIGIDSVRAEIALGSLFSVQPQVTELTLTRPKIELPLLRRRSAAVADANARRKREPGKFAIDRITIDDGTLVMANAAERIDRRIEHINAAIAVNAEQRISVTGGARIGTAPVQFEVRTTPAGDGQPLPVDISFDAPDWLPSKLTAQAELRSRGNLVQINSITGALGDGQFNGWASLDLSSKPLLKLDLDVTHLMLAQAKQPVQPRGGWSEVPFDLTGLNYVDAEFRMSAGAFDAGAAHLAPAAAEGKLADGVLSARFAHLGAYDGEADGELAVDVTGDKPGYTLRCDVAGVRARPLLTALADFDTLDGKMQAKIALTARGDNQRAIVASLSGTAFVAFRDGEIRNLNVARMIRNLTTGTLNGWQDNDPQSTDLTQLTASFRLDQGSAQTADLSLAGPLVRMTGAGTIDLPNKALSFKVEPKLVMTTQGQPGDTAQTNGSAEPVGFGIPVMIEGPWASPRIFPDAAGILDNPDAAYAKLHEMGKGLFGLLGNGNGNGSGGGDGSNGNPLGGALGEGLNRLIQQGLSGQNLGGQNLGGQIPGTRRPDAQQPASPPPSPQGAAKPDDDATMKAIMKQLFSRPQQ